MAQNDTPPHALVGRAGLVFAYVSFALALALFGGAMYFLPLTLKAKLFLGAGVALLTSMFVFLVIATHLVLRPRQKEVGGRRPTDAKGSHRPR